MNLRDIVIRATHKDEICENPRTNFPTVKPQSFEILNSLSKSTTKIQQKIYIEVGQLTLHNDRKSVIDLY